mmetsp:Transcript_10114/g.26097  ORF Transcript_10114/g.26097 Transcript_10114/m.26097 type:complete len:299 (-) Transcript_10114:519-1415(-)
MMSATEPDSASLRGGHPASSKSSPVKSSSAGCRLSSAEMCTTCRPLLSSRVNSSLLVASRFSQPSSSSYVAPGGKRSSNSMVSAPPASSPPPASWTLHAATATLGSPVSSTTSSRSSSTASRVAGDSAIKSALSSCCRLRRPVVAAAALALTACEAMTVTVSCSQGLVPISCGLKSGMSHTVTRPRISHGFMPLASARSRDGGMHEFSCASPKVRDSSSVSARPHSSGIPPVRLLPSSSSDSRRRIADHCAGSVPLSPFSAAFSSSSSSSSYTTSSAAAARSQASSSSSSSSSSSPSS